VRSVLKIFLTCATSIVLLVIPRLANALSRPHNSCHPTTSIKQSINAASHRRSALTKLITAGVGGLAGGITIDRGASRAQAATTALPSSSSSSSSLHASAPRPPIRTNKKVYLPPPNSLNGKVIVITGGTTGLGLESAKRLAAAGATIVLTARTEAKAAKAITDVREYLDDITGAQSSLANGDGDGDNKSRHRVYAVTLNLDDMESITSFPRRYDALALPSKTIDVLMNNAGVAAIPQRELTTDGFERTFQSNHLGPFVLTALLFPYLNRREGSRVVNVSSYAHEFVWVGRSGGATRFGLDVGNLNGEMEYNGAGWPAYCRSKLENVLFTRELQRRADEGGLDWLTAVALHPGVVSTDIWRNTYFGLDQRGQRRAVVAEGKIGGERGVLQSFVSNVFYSINRSVEEGANTQVMLAASGEPKGTLVKGQYFDKNMRLKELSDFARDETMARYLWDKSEELAGIKFEVI